MFIYRKVEALNILGSLITYNIKVLTTRTLIIHSNLKACLANITKILTINMMMKK